MSVLAIFSIGAFPEPTEFLRFDRLNEMFAYDLMGYPMRERKSKRTENDV